MWVPSHNLYNFSTIMNLGDEYNNSKVFCVLYLTEGVRLIQRAGHGRTWQKTVLNWFTVTFMIKPHFHRRNVEGIISTELMIHILYFCVCQIGNISIRITITCLSTFCSSYDISSYHSRVVICECYLANTTRCCVVTDNTWVIELCHHWYR